MQRAINPTLYVALIQWSLTWDIFGGKFVKTNLSHYLFNYLSGYEHYKTMRADPSLCFLSKVGLPSNMNDSIAGEATDPDDR